MLPKTHSNINLAIDSMPLLNSLVQKFKIFSYTHVNQAIIVNYKILVLPVDTIGQYFSSHSNSCLPREG